jgi:phosphatidylglycerol:prolipoprotein diacylglycerol transferase
MHPELFKIGSLTVHTYGFLIMVGAIMGYIYMAYTCKKELNIHPDKIQTLAIWVIFGAFVGGKLFFYFEDPAYYFSKPSRMVENFRTGFVFYGSLLVAVPIAIYFFCKEKWPLWAMLDRLAITTLIIHAFGRLGCFSAGCCYGKPTDVAWGVTFTDPLAKADPLHTALHPTQLYEAAFLFVLLVVLFMFQRYKRFEGQLFIIYLISYAVGRGVIEIYRGDLRRGFIIEDILSHSQFISIFIIALAIWMYMRLSRMSRLRT